MIQEEAVLFGWTWRSDKNEWFRLKVDRLEPRLLFCVENGNEALIRGARGRKGWMEKGFKAL